MLSSGCGCGFCLIGTPEQLGRVSVVCTPELSEVEGREAEDMSSRLCLDWHRLCSGRVISGLVLEHCGLTTTGREA